MVTRSGGTYRDISDSCNPREELGDEEEEHGGLSAFGEEVVAEMNRLGIIIDVSHVSKKGMMDAVRLSQAPIIASHSGARALADVSRNLDDEQLHAIRDNEGVVHVVALDGFLKVIPEKDSAMAALRQELGLTNYAAYRTMTDEQREEYARRVEELDERWPSADVKTMVDHIDYIAQLIGIDHVGIGTDFDGGGGLMGYNDASEAPNLTAELVRRGYSDEDIAKIWSGNFLRVLRENERVAAEIQGHGADH